MSEPKPADTVMMSVVVRSYNRLDACIELLEILLSQDYPRFEIIVVEQSTNSTREQAERLEALRAGNPKLTVLRYPPLGPARARNEGWRHAVGDIVVFCDDDDLPIGAGWLSAHAKNYGDPSVIGVSGREVMSPDETCNYDNIERARRMCLSYSFFEYPNCYCRLDERRENVQWLHGGNASVRRSFIEAADGWYEHVYDHEEHSFAHKLRRILTGQQRLVFDPDPTVLRRKDISGGLDRRRQTARETYLHWFRYLHMIVGRYRTAKFVLLYPAFLVWLVAVTIRGLWQKSARRDSTLPWRLAATLGILAANPVWYVQGWLSTIRRGS